MNGHGSPLERFIPLLVASTLVLAAIPLASAQWDEADNGTSDDHSPTNGQATSANESGSRRPDDRTATGNGTRDANEPGQKTPRAGDRADNETRHGNDTSTNGDRAIDREGGNASDNENESTPPTGKPPGKEKPNASEDRGAKPRDSKDHDDGKKRSWESRERELDVREEPQGFHATSTARDGGDVVTSSYEASRAALTLALAPGADNDSPVRAITANMDSILEFRDENENGRYDIGETVVSGHAVKSLPVTVDAAPSDVGRTVSVHHGLPGGGSLSLIFHLVSVESTSDGANILPTETKYDIIIADYPFVNGDTLLALGTVVSSTAPLKHTVRAGMPTLTTHQADRVVFFSWVPEAAVDGVTTEVAWSVHASVGGSGSSGAETSTDAIVYFTYTQGALVVHDPSLGVMTASIAEAVGKVLGSPAAYIAGAAFAALVVAGAAAGRLRKRR